MYQQVFNPVSDSLGLTSIFAALPLLTLFILLGVFRVAAHYAGLAALAIALLVATIVYSMPVDQALLSASEGAAFGLFPIAWIVITALWIYRMTEETGHFAVLRRSFERVSPDQRMQAILIAFCFGALIEALAGFGTPVAISATMLLGLGFRPIKAASIALVANTAPVAFGAIAIPIITLAEITGLPKEDLGAMVGRQTPFLAAIVPLALVTMVDGARGLRETWPAALVAGVAFGIGQFVTSNYISVEMTDIVAALLSAGSLVLFLRVWSPTERVTAEAGGPRPAMAGGAAADPAFERDVRARGGGHHDRPGQVLEAYAPYLIIIAVFSLAQWAPIKDFLAARTESFTWPGLDILNPKGEAPSATTYNLNWASAAGTLLLVSGLLTMLALRVSPGTALRSLGRTVAGMKWAILTIAAVLALAYVMNLSGQTITLGRWLAGAGGIFAFLSPIIGWLGVAVTGSDTSSNALFGGLQVEAASGNAKDALLYASANSSGGVMGKMISPQNLAVGAAGVAMAGQEGDIFRKVLGWSLGLLLLMAVLVTLQSAILDFMIP